MFGALKVVAPTCVDQGPRRWGPDDQALNSTSLCWIYGVQ
jgi:hypothetical protein